MPIDFQIIKKRVFEDTKELIFGRRFTFPQELADSHKITDSVNVIRDRWPEEEADNLDEEAPVFVFSAGWRSGSTLLQRILMSSGQVVIWGEPLGDTANIARLTHGLTAINSEWPPEHFLDSNSDISELSDKWIANLSPKMTFLRLAHRSFFDEWLSKSAVQTFNVERWGLKEVRLTIDHARYLKWLYPNAKFLFIYRNPFDAFKSWKGNRWRSVWPGYYRKSALAYARHWKLLLDGYQNGFRDVDGLMVKFEDLVSGEISLEQLSLHTGITDIDPDILRVNVRTPKGKETSRRQTLSWLDRLIIWSVCGKLMRKSGYL